MENLEFWNKYKEVPKNALKDFDNGKFKGTDINTMWRLKCLTETFGMCGIGWYFNIKKTWTETTPNGEMFAFAEIELYVKVDNEWSKPISGNGGNKLSRNVKSGGVLTSDEAFKMAVTDAIGVACRNLGMGADVYWANDKTKYTNEPDEEEIVGGSYVLQGGKYDGKTIQEVFDIDKQYCVFCSQNAKSYFMRANFKKCMEDNKYVPEVNV